ncbi:ABC transporter transmembrane domain-containing protein [Mesorhizobium sp.]|uniref:ABC transporter transmembrane domain-containing protein n=1 Tax=Mesorhizobium sp. TaxID=1871066 RepID=UPI000FE869D4|nr:ABC transporter transmembrane domain-containing protein [Mesorhizobium sp.]RWB07633.1 MAG: ABC transporter ATP-binding protein [Mesorhizobium sp.]RWO22889.1 MAG: ABC transporter ATP-binding protein [Mesorhizobium sp.]RWP21211.1 MAG: ABC transporter ATP-binding protein [Mesorhizobium sp.]RWQ06647.1 MAG: ABC transporter ATP-binding protein [Mesorhizobium sp.]RWQ54622.1 MAG: ABC transporter ATP-binding protein [Mesorhizobium sp.]
MPLPGILIGTRLVALAVLVAIGFAKAATSLALVAIVGAAVSGEPQPLGQGRLIVASLSLGIALFALGVMQRRQGAAFALDYVREVRKLLVEQLFALPPGAGRTGLGLVMTRLVTDLSAIRSWLADGVASLFVAGPSVVLIVLGAFWLAPGVAPFLLCGVLAWSIVCLVALPFLHRAIRESRRRRGRLAGRLGDIVVARAAFAHFGKSGTSTRKIDRMSEALNMWLVRRAGWSGAARASSDFVMPVIVVILVAYAFSGRPAILVGDLSTLLLLAGLTVGQLSDLARAADYRLAYVESRRRIASILARPVLADPVSPIPLPRSTSGRRLRIEFHCRNGTPSKVLEAAPGASILLGGDTPEARSALFSSIAGFEENSGLAVFLDDIPVNKISQRDRRRAITLLSPAIPLVRATMVDNIALGAPSATSQEEIIATASLCGLAVDGPPDSSQRRLEPARVSAMQAARIRAARALVRSAAVLLIDDIDVCKDRDLLAAVLAHARAAQTTVIVSCEAATAGMEFDDTWLLDCA